MRGGWAASIALATACTSVQSNGVVGTVVYSEANTENVRTFDLGTGHDTLIDAGHFGLVSIAPDAQHVAYEGADQITKIADRAGAITPLPGAGCAGAATWVSNTVVMYCVANGSMLLPALDGTARMIDSYGVAVSPDDTQVAYVDGQGNVDIEDLDGSNHQILAPSIDPTRPSPEESVVGFTPDQRAVMVADSSTFPDTLHIISVADGSAIDVPNAFLGGTPFGGPRFIGASTFSSDGSEILFESTTDLIAVTLATGVTRAIAAFAANESSGGAVFLDDQLVLWLRVDDHSVGDIGNFTVSLHVAGPAPTDDVVLDSPSNSNPVIPTIAISSEGFIALPSDVLIVKVDGTVLVRNEVDGTDLLADDVIGLTPNGKGIITSSNAGAVRYFGMDGTTNVIVTTAPASFGGLLGPFAAYVPAPAN